MDPTMPPPPQSHVYGADGQSVLRRDICVWVARELTGEEAGPPTGSRFYLRPPPPGVAPGTEPGPLGTERIVPKPRFCAHRASIPFVYFFALGIFGIVLLAVTCRHIGSGFQIFFQSQKKIIFCHIEMRLCAGDIGGQVLCRRSSALLS